ncbi:type II toxin-antitoxin system Phd/YefM family antitoxin [Pectobacterium punjabense]|uniref:Type II toxin-antitoxin system Phd/YefM family antitoxin n=1 Tax=Pectobacterium punjabense TaxID=2108399 RepID=A0ABX6KXC1_9GAMM|nr:type II toxin-antitoxin system Phd/YefM family antitoxin [Pectobacterium punjabense]GKW11288.1 hypothetical protein PEC301899_15700 [Pectobacterium carotovorum subsp. carotovorum]MBS4430164.1 type II toxin-antitoxin system Phd/YefM family antitoxin [Pectobacterium punjabense]MBT9184681.1 type II toxin-antitoxin system Phd/YefM family antitoxin [Pectobacterium punjabense]PTA62587.1 hypothetical protein C9I36_18855 [Pectobacterium punjabense]QJA18691.1 type II toxin-antitoxin system Phd/YefM 
MKSITYTYMREHLTEVLDELRNGVDFIVTQRGKPDLELQGNQIAGFPEESAGAYSSTPRGSSRVKTGEEVPVFPTPRTLFVSTSGSTRRGSSTEHYEKRQTVSQPKKLSFVEAKTRTQKRHAGVIKILGDK